MNAQEKLVQLEKIKNLLSDAWLLAYELREDGVFEGNLFDLRMCINDSQCIEKKVRDQLLENMEVK